jgi:transposase
MASSYYDLLKIDREIDNKVNEAKARLSRLTDLPDDLRKTIVQRPRVRESGLIGLSDALEARNVASNAQELLRRWLAENKRLRSIRAALQDRLIRRRRWFYRNIAAFVTKRYRTIALEGEFAAKEMIEDRTTKDRDLPFQRSIRHYQWTAVAELRNHIIEAAVKNGARIVKTDTRGSTTTCFICGRYTEHQPNLRLTCPSGHTWDQDVNAASNILGRIEGFDKIRNSGTPNFASVIPGSLTRVMFQLF